MVQEAKPDCYKQWYLPAGRVEVGESLEEAMKREVSEEEPEAAAPPASSRGSSESVPIDFHVKTLHQK